MEKKMKIIGHRGAMNEALENTLLSFEKAIDCGCDMIEVDAHLTKDNQIVIHHDQSLKRTAGINRNISELTSLELSGVTFSNGQKLPTLEETLDKILPHATVNIELKTSNVTLIHQLFKLISANDLQKIIISSFDLESLLYIKTYKPECQLALLWGEDNQNNLNPIEILTQNSKFYFHPQADLLTYRLVCDIKKIGTKIFTWIPSFGVEDPTNNTLWAVLKALNVDGICTNFPRELALWLKA